MTGFMETIFSQFFDVWDPAMMTFLYRGEGDEAQERTTFDNAVEYYAAVALDANHYQDPAL